MFLFSSEQEDKVKIKNETIINFFIIFLLYYLIISLISSILNLTLLETEYLSSSFLYHIGNTTTEAKFFSSRFKSSSYHFGLNPQIAHESIFISAKTVITFHKAK